MLDTSVVICCSDDFDIFKTIASIDADVEIICAITPNETIEMLIKTLGLRYVIAPKGNHSFTTNAGIKAASHKKIILMDSDCIFVPGAIQKISNALNDDLVVNGKIIFLDNDSWLSKQIAACRAFDNEWGMPAYKPGLGLRFELAEKIHGWFNQSVHWPIDAEMTYRIRQSNITIKHIDTPCILHRPISLSHNLRASLNYGIGDYTRESRLYQKFITKTLREEPERYLCLIKSKGYSASLYMLLNDFIYYCGFWGAKLGCLNAPQVMEEKA